MREHRRPDLQEFHRWLAVEGSQKDRRSGLSVNLQRKASNLSIPSPKLTDADGIQFIKFVLQVELNLARKKRDRCYAAMIHFIHLGMQLWQHDWHRYDRPGIRIEVWGETQLSAFTSARIGEYLESTCRAGSGRGLYFRASAFPESSLK